MILDIFDDDAFSLVTMSDALQRRPYVPTGIAAMNLFSPRFIRTEDVGFEMGTSSLQLINTSQRGEPIDQLHKRKRSLRKYGTTRLAQATTIWASDLDFLRSMNTEQGLTTLTEEIANRLGHGSTVGILDNFDTTTEAMMLGCLQGAYKDVDGTVIVNWAEEFDGAVSDGGTGTIATLSWNFAPAAHGDFRKQANQHRRAMVTGSNGVLAENVKIMNLCSSGFWDKLCLVPELQKTMANAEQAYFLQGGDTWGQFEYPAGMVWKEYRGTDDGSVGIPANEAVTFPLGVRGLFQEVFAHGETFGDNGTLGRRFYAKTRRDDEDRFVTLTGMQYPLLACTAPRTLRRSIEM